jgi:putative SOS response-associated peptidase YedK
MCGRYALFALPPELIREILGFVPIDEHGLVLPRWNIAPTQQAPVFREAPQGRSLGALRWGLVPSWADDLRFGARCINARAETLAAKPAFRAAFRTRRCLVPATGFYEWTRDAERKQPYVFRTRDGPVFLMAGLWDTWIAADTGEVVESFTIVTTAANDVVRPVHDRMPVILPRANWSSWLDPGNRDVSALAKLLVPWGGAIEARPVAATINDARRDERPLEL